jgi:hypothetical protein
MLVIESLGVSCGPKNYEELKRVDIGMQLWAIVMCIAALPATPSTW